MKTRDKEALAFWNSYYENLRNATPIPIETPKEKKARIQRLLAYPEEFFAFYFPKFCTSPPAKFQIKATKRLIENDVWTEVRAWPRAHAKSARAMMEIFYLVFTKRAKTIILASYNYDNAVELLAAYKYHLESNELLINDFGHQVSLSNWTAGKFITNDKVSFRAIGSGQSPRGTRNMEKRPDTIIVDDLDEDELARNPRRMNEAYDWLKGALYACFDITGTKRFLMLGNIIAKNSLIVRTGELADFYDIVNIFDRKGLPSWSERYSLQECNNMITQLGYRLSQREYFNNPLTIGTIFENISYKPILPLKHYKYLVCYTDPSFKNSATSDYKATVLIGKAPNDEFHVIKAYVDKVSVRQMVLWHYNIHDFVKDQAIVFYYMEANFIQDTLLEEFRRVGNELGFQLPLKPDLRKKPDKFQRIENLEPYFSNNLWFFNIHEKESKGMQTLTEQFILFEKGAKVNDDGPDACEGAVYILNQKTKVATDPIICSRSAMKKFSKYHF